VLSKRRKTEKKRVLPRKNTKERENLNRRKRRERSRSSGRKEEEFLDRINRMDRMGKEKRVHATAQRAAGVDGYQMLVRAVSRTDNQIMIATCYMCDAPATTREHVPPRCLFPKGSKFRANPITVPSCEKHNSEKSKDDELLRNVLVAERARNETAVPVESAALRSFDYRPNLIGISFPNITVAQIGDTELGFATIDLPRFVASIRAIVRGVFYDEFYEKTGRKLFSELTVRWAALRKPDLSTQNSDELIRIGNSLPPMQKGRYPEIFQYDFNYEGNAGLCRLRIYEGHPIYVCWNA